MKVATAPPPHAPGAVPDMSRKHAADFLRAAGDTQLKQQSIRRATLCKNSSGIWVETESHVFVNDKETHFRLLPDAQKVVTIFGEPLFRRKSRHSIPETRDKSSGSGDNISGSDGEGRRIYKFRY